MVERSFGQAVTKGVLTFLQTVCGMLPWPRRLLSAQYRGGVLGFLGCGVAARVGDVTCS